MSRMFSPRVGILHSYNVNDITIVFSEHIRTRIIKKIYEFEKGVGIDHCNKK